MNIKEIVENSNWNVQNINVFVMGSDNAKKDVVNPGIDYGEDGKAKWTPPLQQQLGTMKDAVGPTTDDVTTEPTEQEKQEVLDDQGTDTSFDRIKELAAIFTPTSNLPGQ